MSNQRVVDRLRLRGKLTHHQVELAPERRAPVKARDWVRRHAPPLYRDDEATLALLTSEVVTNAVVHAGTRVMLGLTLADGALLVTAADYSHDLPDWQPAGEMGTTGRGLEMLEALADRWGVEPDEAGKTVWFLMRCPVAEPTGRSS